MHAQGRARNFPMTLKLHDTLTRKKREFVPIDPGNVRLYVCGPTVYDFAHIGNARPVIVFDMLFRLLRRLYGDEHVTYVRNITDVDDKINERAARDFPALALNEAIRRVTETTAKQFHEDIGALGCLQPSIEPRATEHIEEMRALIERLVQGGFAYVAQNHVLFSPAAMDRAAKAGTLPRYGALANRSLDEMLAGARVDVAPYKRDPMDFVLWKPSKEGEPGLGFARRHRGDGAARLAYRMLGHVVEASRRAFRHPRRGHRSRLPPSRERDRAIMLRLRPSLDGELLDAQRISAGRRTENVQKPWEFRHDQRAFDDATISADVDGRVRSCGWPCWRRTIVNPSIGRSRGSARLNACSGTGRPLSRMPRRARCLAASSKRLTDDLNTPKLHRRDACAAQGRRCLRAALDLELSGHRPFGRGKASSFPRQKPPRSKADQACEMPRGPGRIGRKRIAFATSCSPKASW